MEIDKFGKGGIREDIPDPRDYLWGRDIGMAAIPFDWDAGYDVEVELAKVLNVPSFKLPVKNQGISSSCGGQGWAYYGEVLDTVNDKEFQEKSAKFIYAHTHVGTGGSGGRENSNLVITKGWGNEADCPSYENGLPPSEAFMIMNDITPAAFANALKDRGLAYANVLDRDPENIATAVRDNYGAVFGTTGTNNGTWRSVFPKPPIGFANSWNHWLYVGKAKMINGKRHFGIINSWGDKVGEKGWQWISEDYIKTFILGYPAIYSIWTMVARKDVVVPTLPPFKFTKTLRFGMTDFEVKKLQEVLKVIQTGFFGNLTLKAVIDFQKLNGLTADGVVGKATRDKLNV